MNETTPFFQSWIFDLILLFGGAIVGYFTACLCAVSSRASRDEERWEEEARLKKEITKMSKEDKLISIIKGRPDRE